MSKLFSNRGQEGPIRLKRSKRTKMVQMDPNWLRFGPKRTKGVKRGIIGNKGQQKRMVKRAQKVPKVAKNKVPKSNGARVLWSKNPTVPKSNGQKFPSSKSPKVPLSQSPMVPTQCLKN